MNKSPTTSFNNLALQLIGMFYIWYIAMIMVIMTIIQELNESCDWMQDQLTDTLH